MATQSIKLELNQLILMIPQKKIGRARDLIRALINDNIIDDNLSDDDISEIKQGIEDTEKGRLYSVSDVITEYKRKKSYKR